MPKNDTGDGGRWFSVPTKEEKEELLRERKRAKKQARQEELEQGICLFCYIFFDKTNKKKIFYFLYDAL